jgi:hypothetical protein
MSDNDDIKALRAEFQAKDEAYEREFKRINIALGDMRSDFQSGLRDVFNKLDVSLYLSFYRWWEQSFL